MHDVFASDFAANITCNYNLFIYFNISEKSAFPAQQLLKHGWKRQERPLFAQLRNRPGSILKLHPPFWPPVKKPGPNFPAPLQYDSIFVISVHSLLLISHSSFCFLKNWGGGGGLSSKYYWISSPVSFAANYGRGHEVFGNLSLC